MTLNITKRRFVGNYDITLRYARLLGTAAVFNANAAIPHCNICMRMPRCIYSVLCAIYIILSYYIVYIYIYEPIKGRTN